MVGFSFCSLDRMKSLEQDALKAQMVIAKSKEGKKRSTLEQLAESPSPAPTPSPTPLDGMWELPGQRGPAWGQPVVPGCELCDSFSFRWQLPEHRFARQAGRRRVRGTGGGVERASAAAPPGPLQPSQWVSSWVRGGSSALMGQPRFRVPGQQLSFPLGSSLPLCCPSCWLCVSLGGGAHQGAPWGLQRPPEESWSPGGQERFPTQHPWWPPWEVRRALLVILLAERLPACPPAPGRGEGGGAFWKRQQRPAGGW